MSKNSTKIEQAAVNCITDVFYVNFQIILGIFFILCRGVLFFQSISIKFI